MSRRLVTLTLSVSLALLVGLAGCGQPTQTIYLPAPDTSTQSSNPVVPTTTGQSWSWVPSPRNILTGGSYAYFPLNGAYVEAGHTLTLSWSADNNVECFIFTVNQYNNFIPLSIASAWMAHGQGTNGVISAHISNSDTYYVVCRNTFTFGSSVKLYQVVLTVQQ